MFDYRTLTTQIFTDPVFFADYETWVKDCYKSTLVELIHYGVPGWAFLMFLGNIVGTR